MRRLVVVFFLICFAAGLAEANTLSGIGFIDVQKVFKEYKETSKAQEDLSKQEDRFKKEFEESQKKLEKAEQDGKKKEEIEKMRKELEEKLTPKRDQLLRLNQELTGKLQAKILEGVKKVSKKVGIEVVLDKQVVITGGMDLTDLVINELNK